MQIFKILNHNSTDKIVLIKKRVQILIVNWQSENDQGLLIVNHPTIVQNTVENSCYKRICQLLFCFYKFQSFYAKFSFLLMSSLLFW